MKVILGVGCQQENDIHMKHDVEVVHKDAFVLWVNDDDADDDDDENEEADGNADADEDVNGNDDNMMYSVIFWWPPQTVYQIEFWTAPNSNDTAIH